MYLQLYSSEPALIRTIDPQNNNIINDVSRWGFLWCNKLEATLVHLVATY